MSEEILKALMQLFAIILKQDGVVTKTQHARVESFLKQQISPDQVAAYLALFEDASGYNEKPNPEEDGKKKLTSVKDSVRTLGICKKINKTLEQKQKIVVFIRILEMIWADESLGPLAMEIVETVAKVFKIDKAEYASMTDFAFDKNEGESTHNQLLLIDGNASYEGQEKHIYIEQFSGSLKILKVNSVELYFLKVNASNINMNGLPLRKGKLYLFPSGSTIKPPSGKPIYYSEVAATFLKDAIDVNISFVAKDVQYVFPKGNIGLRDINIAEDTGKLVGIMGASGAGKSTLLNILNGNEAPTEGKVLINGIDIHREKEDVTGVIGYVPQDDLLIDELTVYQNLFYNGKLCLDELSDEELHERIISLLKSLDLMATKDLKVGNVLEKTISGGQRKRLNIGLELLREPSVLFVDEPTSGLSSRDSENIMDLLKELTLKGKLIFVVIHQPSSDIYKLFDKMFILDVGGYCVYYGNPVEALLYFKRKANQANQDIGECITCGNVNPELVFNIIDAKLVDDYGRYLEQRKVSPEQWNHYYQEEFDVPQVPSATDAPPNSLSIPKKLQQWWVFTKRDVHAKLKNTQYMLINVLEAPVLALVLAFIVKNAVDSDQYNFYKNENIPAFIFMSIVVALFMGLTISAEEIIKDRKILKREKFLSLNKAAYLFSKVGILFSFSAIQTALFVWIGNGILDIQGMNFTYWLTLFTVACFANILGLNISASFKSAVTIYILIPLILIPQMILSGAIFSFDRINRFLGAENTVPVVAEVMASRWAFEALAVAQFKRNGFEKDLYFWNKLQSDLNYRMAYWIPELRSLAGEAVKATANGPTGDTAQAYQNLQVIQKALQAENTRLPQEKQYPIANNWTAKSFSDADFAAFKDYLEELNDFYAEYFTQVEDLLTEKKATLFASGGENRYNLYQAAYANESLAELVRNTTASQKIKVIDGRLQQIIDPVYRTPLIAERGYRAHLYAPLKPIPFTHKYTDTFTYNLLVIWLMSLLAFIALYFDWLKKLIDRLAAIQWPALPKLSFQKVAAKEKPQKKQ